METHTKVWGAEIWIANNSLYCGKKLLLKKGFQCSIHHHKIKDETFYIESGKVLMEYEDAPFKMLPGDSLRILPGVRHRFTGLEDSVIFEFSTQHFESDSYRDTKSGPVE